MNQEPEGKGQGPNPSDGVTLFGTAVPLLCVAGLLLSKHVWESYAPSWLNDMTEQRVALLGMVAGTATLAAIIRIIVRPGSVFGIVFAGTAGLATFGAGYVQLTSLETTWYEELLAVFIGLTIVPAFPSMANRIYALPSNFKQLVKSRVGVLFLLGILFIVSLLMAEWVHDGYIARMRSIGTAIGRAILTVVGGLFGLTVIGYFGWLVWKLAELIGRAIWRVAGRTKGGEEGPQDQG